MYCSLHGENTSHTSRECNVLKSKGKENPKFSKKYFKKKSREINLLEKKASQKKEKYLKYKSLNKAYSKKKTPVILEDSESYSSSSSEEENSSDEGEENSMTYDSESGGSDKSSNSATDTEEEAWNNGCRDLIIIDKWNNSTSNIKEHKLSSNNLDTALRDAHLLNTLRKPSKMVIQTNPKRNWNTNISVRLFLSN